MLKKLNEKEERCFTRLMQDELKQFVPEYKGKQAEATVRQTMLKINVTQ
jgi:hypothetical protein